MEGSLPWYYCPPAIPQKATFPLPLRQRKSRHLLSPNRILVRPLPTNISCLTTDMRVQRCRVLSWPHHPSRKSLQEHKHAAARWGPLRVKVSGLLCRVSQLGTPGSRQNLGFVDKVVPRRPEKLPPLYPLGFPRVSSLAREQKILQNRIALQSIQDLVTSLSPRPRLPHDHAERRLAREPAWTPCVRRS